MVPALLPFSPPPRGLRRRRCLSCCSSGVRSPRPVPCSAAGRCRLLRRQRWPPRRHGGPRRSMKRRRSLIRRTRAAPRLGAAALCRCARSRTGRRCQPRMERETSVPQGCRPVLRKPRLTGFLSLYARSPAKNTTAECVFRHIHVGFMHKLRRDQAITLSHRHHPSIHFPGRAGSAAGPRVPVRQDFRPRRQAAAPRMDDSTEYRIELRRRDVEADRRHQHRGDRGDGAGQCTARGGPGDARAVRSITGGHRLGQNLGRRLSATSSGLSARART